MSVGGGVMHAEIAAVLAGERKWCIVTGDCLEVLPTLPDGCVDVTITSPPYNLGNTSGGGFPRLGHYDSEAGLMARGGHGKWRAASKAGGIGHGYATHGDCLPHGEYVAWQKECLFAIWRVVADNGAVFYNHKPRVLNGLLVTPLEYNPGLPVRQIVIWARAGGINFSPAFYVPTHEWVVIFAQQQFRLKSKGASGVGDVWRIAQEENKDHPAPFPVDLPLKILETVKAEVVLDPFAGIASTGVACLQTGRRFIGVELSPEYADLARRRLEAAERDERCKLFPARERGPEQADLFGEG